MLDQHSTPVNKAASRVAFARGDSFEPTLQPNTCPDIWMSPPAYERGVLSDTRHGRIVYLGLPLERKAAPKYGARWIVRCDCGNFTTKRAASRTKTSSASMMCVPCAVTNDLERKYKFRKQEAVKHAI